MEDIRIRKYARFLIRKAVYLQKGEKILIELHGDENAIPLVRALVEEAYQKGIPIISSMGAGNKLDPTRFQVADLFDTSVCPLCRVMRREVRRRNIPHLKVVYSTEPALSPALPQGGQPLAPGKHQTPGSVAFVPSVAGLILAGEVVKDLSLS